LVLFNYSLKELTAKIVFYGPGLGGKTTNLHYIHEELPLRNKGRLLSLATETDRTLYFDFLPVEAGMFRGIKTRIQIYTVPGQVFYNATRRMVLKGADGVVFVADSQRAMMEANLESLSNLRENLLAHDLRLEEIPLVIQYNKRDLPDVMSVDEMCERINTLNVPFYEAVATEGIGVEDTLKAISSLVLRSVMEKYGTKPGAGLPAEEPAVAVAGGGAFTSERWSPKEPSDSFASGGSGDATGDDMDPAEPDPFSELTGEEISQEDRRRAVTKPSSRMRGSDKSDEIFSELDIEEVLDGALSSPDVKKPSRKTTPLSKVWKSKKKDVNRGADTLEEDEIAALVDSFASGDPSLANVVTAPELPEKSDVGFHELDLGGEAFVDPSQPSATSPNIELRIDAPPGTGKPQRVVIPVRLSIDPDANDVEFHLTLHIRVQRRRD
jgi:signal recognition particle receptor subunit beta